MNKRDIVVKTTSGLYLKQLDNGSVCLTTLQYATHFTSKKEMRKAIAKSGYKNLLFTDFSKIRRNND